MRWHREDQDRYSNKQTQDILHGAHCTPTLNCATPELSATLCGAITRTGIMRARRISTAFLIGTMSAGSWAWRGATVQSPQFSRPGPLRARAITGSLGRTIQEEPLSNAQSMARFLRFLSQVRSLLSWRITIHEGAFTFTIVVWSLDLHECGLCENSKKQCGGS